MRVNNFKNVGNYEYRYRYPDERGYNNPANKIHPEFYIPLFV